MKNNLFEDNNINKGQRNALLEILIKKGITDAAVLKAMQIIPRHLFLPKEFQSHAYEDKAFPIDENQTISQPYTVAYQTSLLEIKPGDKVLEIGTGSGYQAMVLALLGANLHSVERHAVLHQKSKIMFSEITKHFIFNIPILPYFYLADGSVGLKNEAPFDKIIVTAAAPAIPKTLVEQLKIGGIMVIPVGKSQESQRMVKLVKTSATKFDHQVLSQFSFVPLLGENGWQ